MKAFPLLPLLAAALLAAPAVPGTAAPRSMPSTMGSMQGMMSQMQGMMTRIQGMMGGQQAMGGHGMMGGQQAMGGHGMMGSRQGQAGMRGNMPQLRDMRGMAESMSGMMEQMQTLMSDSTVMHNRAARDGLLKMKSQMGSMMSTMSAMLDELGQVPQAQTASK
jgi:hypothetical protein